MNIWERPMQNTPLLSMKELNKEKIEKAINEVYSKEEYYPKHHVWEENGEKFSCWEIKKGLYTGDKGYEEFCKLLQEECEKFVGDILLNTDIKTLKDDTK